MKLLFVFAHPDDESYGPAGTILHYAHEGTETYLVTLTRGESGKLGICKTLSKPEVAELRIRELQCAVKVLHVKKLTIGDFPDGGLEDIPDSKGIGFISQSVAEINPDAIVTFYKSGITGHADHKIVSRWVTSAVKNSFSQTRLFHFGLTENQAQKITDRKMYAIPESEITHQIDISAYIEQKKEAIKCHDSQLEIFEKMQRFDGGFEQFHRIESFSNIWPKKNYAQRQNRLI